MFSKQGDWKIYHILPYIRCLYRNNKCVFHVNSTKDISRTMTRFWVDFMSNIMFVISYEYLKDIGISK